MPLACLERKDGGKLSQKIKMEKYVSIITIILLLLLSSAIKLCAEVSVKRQYDAAKQLLEDKKYNEAVEQFKRIVDKHPDSEWADDALYMIGKSCEAMAESYTEMLSQHGNIGGKEWYQYAENAKKEFLQKYGKHGFWFFGPGASFHYKSVSYHELIGEYPKSEWADDAAYRITQNRMYGDWEGGPGKLKLSLRLYEPFFSKYPDSEYIKDCLEDINNSFPHPIFYHETHGDPPFWVMDELLNESLRILKLVEDGQDISHLLFRIAGAYERIEQYEKAKQVYQKILRDYPEHKDAERIGESVKRMELRIKLEQVRENRDADEIANLTKSLRQLEIKEANRLIEEGLGDEDARVRLEAIGESAVFPLIGRLKGGKITDNLRSNIIWILGEIGSQRAVPILMENLQSDDSSVRREATRALGKTKDKNAIPVLMQMLNDENRGTRIIAAKALSRSFAQDLTFEQLIAIVSSDVSQPVVSKVFNELGNRKDERAVPVLINALKDERGWMRQEAVVALGKIGGDEAKSALKRMLSDKAENVRMVAREALETMR